MSRVNEVLRREIATVLYRVMQTADDVDMAAVTLTEVRTSPDLRHAEVMVSVRAGEDAARRMVSRMNGARAEIQREVAKHVVLKYTPRLHFKRDTAIQRGDEVLAILEKLGGVPRPTTRSRTMGRRPRRDDANIVNGILLVDKPAGMTSHDVVDRVRRRFNIKKVGHGGTLDPQATGLLVLLLGRGTKSSEAVMKGDKTYEGTMRLGVTTTSQDADGEVLEERDPSGVTRGALEAEIAKWDGEVEQTPPMVSAIKKGGVPLYKMARKGQEIEREARTVRVYDFELLDFAPPDVRFRVSCGKGTYIRTLAHDIGEGLGCGAHLAALRRTRSGEYFVEHAIALDALLELELQDLGDWLLPVVTVV